MKEFKINEVLNDFHTGYKDHLVQVHTMKTDDLNELFGRMYAFRRSARYDSARHYNFEDLALEEKYKEWVSKNETIEMYYGGATVD